MIFIKKPGCSSRLVFAAMLAATGVLAAADGSNSDDVATLKAQIAAQLKQLQALQTAIANQQKLLEKVAANAEAHAPSPVQSQPPRPASLGEVTSLTPMIPPMPVTPTLPVTAALQKEGSTSNPCETGTDNNAVPPYLRLGNVCITPVGLMDLTFVWRDKNAGSGIGTNFGSVPYNNAATAKNSEFHVSPQNSRIGFRIDGQWKDVHFIGYNEFDFLSSAVPTSAGVSNGAFVPRLRLFWIDARKGKVEFLAGQSWSMMVPNRTGLSALPGDLFYSQVVDVNYMAGLTWTRQPGVRIIYHPTSTIAMGLSVENSDQYIGGSAGGSGITAPAALAGIIGAQLDNTTANTLSTPALTPDFIAKVAFDPSPRAHIEVAGIASTFKVWNSLTNTYSTTAGRGGSLNANFEVVKGLRVVTNNFYGSGEGRYLFGQAPDVTLAADGSLHTVNSAGFVEGFELTTKNWQWYTYFGDIYIDKSVLLDANGKTLIGYGYTGSPNSQNRNLLEYTLGYIHTIWKDPRYGAISWMGQYEWMFRDPWYVAPGAPKGTHDNTVYVNIRYSLPGSMPKF